MLKRILSLIKKEFLIIWRDPKSRMLIILPPLMQLFIFAHAMTMEIKNIDMAVLDRSNTTESRELISRFYNSKWFRKIHYRKTLKELKNDIDLKNSQLGIIIQNDFAKKINEKTPTEILIITDGRQTNSASIISGYASQIIGIYNSELEKKLNIKKTQINVITRNWFNPNIEYKW